MILIFIKQSITPTPERKKRLSFKIYTLISSILPFIGLIIATNMSYRIKTSPHPDPDDNFYAGQLKIVGAVKPGLDILRSPKFRHEFGPFFADSIPLALGELLNLYICPSSLNTSSTLPFRPYKPCCQYSTWSHMRSRDVLRLSTTNCIF